MITEDFVSFETAKLLKDKEFRCDILHYYYDKDGDLLFSAWGIDAGKNEFVAPTLQMAMKWLREEKKLSIIIQICFDDNRNREPGYYFEIWQLTPPYESPDTPVLVFDTHEEASEAAIKYCLENLI